MLPYRRCLRACSYHPAASLLAGALRAQWERQQLGTIQHHRSDLDVSKGVVRAIRASGKTCKFTFLGG